MNSNKHYLLFDISSVLYRTFFANKNVDEETGTGLAFHSALVTLNSFFRKVKPHQVVMAFDRNSWRKDYTADETLCVSKKPYKGNRRQNMTPSEKHRYEQFVDHLRELEYLLRQHTTIVCLAQDGLEADDLLAGFVQKYPDDTHVVVSSDKDLLQLLGNPNVTLVDPATGKNRDLDEWNGDANYFLFEKFLRGDRGDHVQSAFPGVRSKKILQAYTDVFAKNNMLGEQWTDAHKNTFTVRDLFFENQLLMDLSAQPECTRRTIDETIEQSMSNPGKFSFFHLMKFLGKYELKKVADNIEQYTAILSR